MRFINSSTIKRIAVTEKEFNPKKVFFFFLSNYKKRKK
jgi:hypothetical protein